MAYRWQHTICLTMLHTAFSKSSSHTLLIFFFFILFHLYTILLSLSIHLPIPMYENDLDVSIDLSSSIKIWRNIACLHLARKLLGERGIFENSPKSTSRWKC